MKILQLGKHYPPFIGGTEKVIQVLTETLNALGISTDVLCSNTQNKFEEINFGNYKVYKTPRWFRVASTSISPLMIKKLSEIKNYYDIIHIHMPDPMANLALFLIQPKVKIVLQWHMDIVKQKILFYFYKPLAEWLFNRADLILVSSKKLKEESQFKNYLAKKGEVLPLPFDDDEFKNLKIDKKYEDELSTLANGRKIVLSVGRLVYYKGFDVLIKAGTFLPENIVIFILGEGPLRRKLEKLIKQYKLNNKVYLLGSISRDKIATCYKICDIFCLPSIYKTESFGLVQLEAMSFGKPVISTKLPASGVCEVNIDGETGLCIKPGDEKELAQAIVDLICNQSLYQKFSLNALKRVNEFCKEKVVRRLIELYKSLL